MRFIRKGGRVIPIRDKGSVSRSQGAREGAKAFAKAGAAAGAAIGTLQVGTGAALGTGVAHLLTALGHPSVLKVNGAKALGHIARQSAGFAILGGTVGAGIGALTAKRKGLKKRG